MTPTKNITAMFAITVSALAVGSATALPAESVISKSAAIQELLARKDAHSAFVAYNLVLDCLNARSMEVAVAEDPDPKRRLAYLPRLWCAQTSSLVRQRRVSNGWTKPLLPA